MAGIKVSVKPEIITWVLGRVEMEHVAYSTIDLLTQWQNGEKIPTFHQVEEISRKINIPFGYFFLDKPPVETCSIMDFRTIDRTPVPEPSRNLMDTFDLMTDIQDWMTDYVKENGQDELDFVGCVNANTPISTIADSIRIRLELRETWFEDCRTTSEEYKLLRTKIEDIGVLVMANGIVGNNTKRKLNVDEFRAFTLVNRYAPLIFINNCDTDTGKLFSIVHELTHVWLGVDSMFNDNYGEEYRFSTIEKTCNAVAAEILVPDRMFLEYWDRVDLDIHHKIEVLADHFHCSRYVIARRALDHRFFSRNTYAELVKEYTKQFQIWNEEQKEKESGGGNYYKTKSSRLDHRFVQALYQSTKEGRTSYPDAYRLTDTNRKTFQRLMNEIGGARW